jgi:phosphoesterase RecJ-like protein
MVDCNTIERTGLSALGARLPFVGQGTAPGGKNIKVKTTTIIDHHPTISPDKRHIIWVDVKASAAGELIYKLLKALRIPIDKKIATNLYTAILTDTGGFRYSNTSIESVRIASNLIEAGAEPWKIAKEVYESISLNCLRLLSQMLQTLEKQGKIAWVTVTRLMFKKTSTCAQDTENFVDYPRKVKGIEVAVFFREKAKNRCKVSLRSKGKVNVADIAKTFGGGGHVSAAGCVVNGSLTEVKKKVLKAVRKALKT